MFFLVFLVMFNIKKGSIAAYSSSWYFNLYTNLYTSYITVLSNNLKPKGCTKDFFITWRSLIPHRYQFTSITSRSTSYFLFIFWMFFFFYGETLLLVLFNYSTLTDTVQSSSFFLVKQHVVFMISTSSSKLLSCINFYIFFLTSSAFVYILNLRYSYSYDYFRLSAVNSNLIITVAFLYAVFFN